MAIRKNRTSPNSKTPTTPLTMVGAMQEGFAGAFCCLGRASRSTQTRGPVILAHNTSDVKSKARSPSKRPGLNTPALSFCAGAKRLLAQVVTQSLRRPLLRWPARDAQRLEVCLLGGRRYDRHTVLLSQLDKPGRGKADQFRPGLGELAGHIPHPSPCHLPTDGMRVVDQHLVKVTRPSSERTFSPRPLRAFV
jgi:hypothetical protein